MLLTGDVVAVSGCASSSAVNVWCKHVELLAVLVSDDGASCGSCVSSNGYSTLK